MSLITEGQFARIADGIFEDRESIIRHNPIGTAEETLLWMTMSALTMYLSLSEIETPCFTGRPDAETYRNAILFILDGRMAEVFDPEKYLNRFSEL
ncbi:MAG TPA: hypothetical protein VK918_00220 [Pyrinomonadaceae bacterium]|nr:hypothetical protein [Pyrinomonadaceae bacterium]